MGGRVPMCAARRWGCAASLLALAAAISSAPGCAALGHVDHPRPVVRAPIPSRNLHPLAQTLLAFRPRRAAITPAGELETRVSVSYASIEEENSDGRNQVVFDGELGRISLAARVGIADVADLEVELPFLYTTSGFLDRLVESFHEALSLPDGGRDERASDQFEMRMSSADELLYQVEEDRFGLQDIPLYLALGLRAEDESGPGIAARLGVELPAGDEEAGFGNGAFDWGLGFVVERSFGRWTLLGGSNYVFPGQPPGFAASDRHRVEDFLDLQIGVEYRWSNRVSLLMQTTWTGSIVDTIPLEEIDREVFDLGLGLGVDTGARSYLSFSIHEDLVSATGVDFSALLSWRAVW